jgi:exoribonuclease R
VPDATRRDARDLELVTVDPAGSRDLDQAFHAERDGGGFRVHYAIADVAAFVTPGGAVDQEAWSRGETLYLPDGRAPLYPDVVGEGAASLLPEVDRPAVLWTFELDRDARPLATRCDRATVRSRAAWSYVDAQAAIERGDAPPTAASPLYNTDHALGDADTASAYVERLRAAGVDNVMCLIQMGTLTQDEMLESIRIFGEQVIPHFRTQDEALVQSA